MKFRARNFVACPRNTWERQHIRGVVFPAELAIEPAQLRVAGDQAVERQPFGDLLLEFAREVFDGAGAHIHGDAAKRDATAFGREHGGAQACGAASAAGVSGSVSFKVSCLAAPMVSL